MPLAISSMMKKFIALAGGALAMQLLILAPAALAATPTPTPTATPSPTPAVIGQNFAVSWSDPANGPDKLIAGYKLKYGSATGNYTTTIDSPGAIPAGQSRTKDFDNFPAGTIFLALTAYNQIGIEGPPSPEIKITVLGTPLPPGTPGITSNGMVNISTRATVAEGDKALIGGFILENPERVAVRAIGPSLVNAGIPDALTQTSVELHDASGVAIETNNGWKTGPDAAALIALKLAPTSDKESALVASLGAGAYTAIVRGPGAEVGTGLVEVYQLP